MKSKLAQLAIFISKIDRRHIQLTYLAIMFFFAPIVIQGPSDGGTGPT